jgi:superfamily II DNA or RNA helicase
MSKKNKLQIVSSSDEIESKADSKELEKMFKLNECGASEKYYDKECNKFLLKKELVEHVELEEHPDSDTYLYPNMNDPNFNIKIAEKKEFNDTKYDGKLRDIKDQAEILSKAEFEMAPHQAFVRNFLSFQTPYNSLLLYHGLGSGKTLSSIGVCEEMREYLKQMGINKRIIVVASPNVQDNFRLQLFDERKLKKVDGIWSINNFIGNKLVKEVNPMNMKNVPREKIISQIKTLINTSYLFLGYGEFANYIRKVESVKEEYKNEKDKESRRLRNLRNEFNSRLIVIDEVHNIRITEDNENKKVAMYLMSLVKAAENMRLLLLSATPMYNSYKEIIWLLNLMNVSDRRATIEIKDVFDKNGNFKEGGEELLARKATGYVSFVRGDNPYTFPFRVFPNDFDKKRTFKDSKNKYPKYQMNGKEIKESDKLKILDSNVFLTNIGSYQSKGYKYIIDHLRKKQITITTKKGVVRDMPSFENMESFGYTLLQMPLEALNIVYPLDILDDAVKNIKPVTDFSDESLSHSLGSSNFSEDSIEVAMKKTPPKVQTPIESEDEAKDDSEYEPEEEDESEEDESEKKPKKETGKVLELTQQRSNEKSISSLNGGENTSSSSGKIIINPHELTGIKGLERMMSFVNRKTPPEFGSFEYKEATERKYGKIFSQNEIGKYSSKIKNICESIVSSSGKISEGVILIYSQYIPGGLLPIALALEEMGFTRFGENVKSFFKNPPTPAVDSRTMKPRVDRTSDFMPARYVMITGDPRISPNNDFDVKALTGIDNKDGNKIKVVLISKAGSEGLDFKYIRQVHILEPWYNLNRIEQIIGRAVRNFSHKDLPFEKRNVEIFMYGSLLEDKEEESADVYVYRVAEFKAIQIGKVSRLLKETSVDCIINYEQSNFSQEIIADTLKEPITQILSNGKVLKDFKAGDAPYSAACDYMEDCQYKCRPFKEIEEEDLKEDTYNESFIMMNSEKIIQKIRALMKEKFFYKKKDLIERINVPKKYPLVQIYAALTQLIDDNNEFITDKFGRTGYLINIDEYYLFQPSELNYKNVSIFDRSVPIDYKHNMIKFDIKKEIAKSALENPQVEIQKKVVHSEIQNVLQQLKNKFDLARDYTKPNKSVSSTEKDADNNWYRYCGIVIRKMASQGVPLEYLLEFLVEHIVDMLAFNEKVELLNYLYSLDIVDERSFEGLAKEYLDKKILKTSTLTAIILYDMDKRKILKLDEKKNKWVDAEPEDIKDLTSIIKESFSIKTSDFNNLVGFIGSDDKKKFMVFKLKNMKEKRHTGARCDQKTKAKILESMNDIEGEEKYTKENTKGVVQSELCPLQEFTLRNYNKSKKNGRIWFLDSETAKIYGF